MNGKIRQKGADAEVLKGKLIYIHVGMCVRICCAHKYLHILYVGVDGNTYVPSCMHS